MKIKKISVIFLLILSTFFCFACGGKTNPQTPPTVMGDVSGVVTSYREFCGGVTVSMGGIKATTNEKGEYVLKDVLSDNLLLTFSKEGYIKHTKKFTKSDFADKAVTFDVDMFIQSAISGTIDSEFGPVEGVKVSVGSLSVLSDKSGKYNLENIPATTIMIMFDKDGYISSVSQISFLVMQSGKVTVDLNMQRALLMGISSDDISKLKTQTLTTFNTGDIDTKFSKFGQVVKHSEGVCLQTAFLYNKVQSHIYAKFSITEETATLNLSARRFIEQGVEAYLSVTVVNQADETIVLKEVNTDSEWYAIDTDAYKKPSYDLTEFIGQDIVISLGIKSGTHCAIDKITLTK